jgi:hypothetical protein
MITQNDINQLVTSINQDKRLTSYANIQINNILCKAINFDIISDEFQFNNLNSFDINIDRYYEDIEEEKDEKAIKKYFGNTRRKISNEKQY